MPRNVPAAGRYHLFYCEWEYPAQHVERLEQHIDRRH